MSPVAPRPLPRVPPAPVPATRALQAGAAVRDITPGFRASLAGWGPDLAPRRVQQVWGRLFARVLVLDDGAGERVALVAADLHAGTRLLAERLAARTAPQGLDVGRLFLCGTHTHSGPGNLYGSVFYDSTAQTDVGVHEELVAFLVDRLAEAVQEACDNLVPARVGTGAAWLWGWSRNRSLPGAAANFPDAAGLAAAMGGAGTAYGGPAGAPAGLDAARVAVDPRVQVVWAERAEAPHAPIGAFGLWGAHASLLEKRHQTCSADLFGVAAQVAEAALARSDAEAFPVALAAGAIGDADASYPNITLQGLQRERRDFARNRELVESVGRAVGGALVEACRAARARASASVRLSCRFDEPVIRDAVLADGSRLAAGPMVGAPTLAGSELGRGAPVFEEGQRRHTPSDDPHWPKAPPEALERHLDDLLRYHPHTLPLRVVRIGSTCLLGLPGEPTAWLAHGLAERARRHGAQDVLVAGVCGDYGGYLTTRAEYAQQQYEGSSTLWGRHTEGWLHERLEALLALPGSTPAPSAPAAFTLRTGTPERLEAPRPPSLAASLPWARGPWLDVPEWDGARLRLSGGWYAWAPQAQRELGWGPWLQVEDAGAGAVLVHGGRPVDDVRHRFVLRFFPDARHVDWRWELFLDDAAGLAGRLLRVRVLGPPGVRVHPPQGAEWPVRRVPARP